MGTVCLEMMHKGENIASAVFFPIAYEFNIEVREHQTSPIWEAFYKISDKYPCQKQGKTEAPLKCEGD